MQCLSPSLTTVLSLTHSLFRTWLFKPCLTKCNSRASAGLKAAAFSLAFAFLPTVGSILVGLRSNAGSPSPSLVSETQVDPPHRTAPPTEKSSQFPLSIHTSPSPHSMPFHFRILFSSTQSHSLPCSLSSSPLTLDRSLLSPGPASAYWGAPFQLWQLWQLRDWAARQPAACALSPTAVNSWSQGPRKHRNRCMLSFTFERVEKHSLPLENTVLFFTDRPYGVHLWMDNNVTAVVHIMLLREGDLTIKEPFHLFVIGRSFGTNCNVLGGFKGGLYNQN